MSLRFCGNYIQIPVNNGRNNYLIYTHVHISNCKIYNYGTWQEIFVGEYFQEFCEWELIHTIIICENSRTILLKHMDLRTVDICGIQDSQQSLSTKTTKGSLE